MSDMIDRPSDPRDSERLDVSKLEPYLREHLDGFDGPLDVQQFRKGHSNLTYFISDGTTGWVLRRPPFGAFVKSAHDMGREYRILKGLYAAYPLAPRATLYCEDESVIGAPFYVMQRLEGVILRRDLPKGMELGAEAAAGLGRAFVENLVRIHSTDLDKAGLADLGHPEGYVRRQVEGWTKRYFKSQTDDIPDIVRVSEWLAEKMPDDHAAGLIHNDYKFDNLLLDPAEPTRIIGVLDWEMATVGHPLMDLGTTLSYWVQDGDPPPFEMVRMGPTNVPGMLTREALVDAYGELTGRDMSAIDFYQVFGLFKTAVVLQQIYYRYDIGKTDDQRFAMFIHFVRLLGEKAAAVVEASKL